MAKNLAMISLCFACGFWNSPSWGQQQVCLSFQQQNNQAADVRGIPALERSQGQSNVGCDSARIRELLFVLVGLELVTLDTVLVLT